MKHPTIGRTMVSTPIAAMGAILAVASVMMLTASSGLPARAGVFGSFSSLVDRTAAAHPNALWHVVHGLCMRAMQATGQPAPCIRVDLAGGYAVLGDVSGGTQLLLVPTVRLLGIESPSLQAPQSPNYWQAAWSSRRLIEQRIGRRLRREDVGLAVNSAYGRTQNQLHVHIDCVQPAVQQALRLHMDEIGPAWTALQVRLQGHRYHVRWVAGEDLGRSDPFKLLAAGDRAARRDMGRETLVVIGAVRPGAGPGFVLLSDRANPEHDDLATGEDLLDHKCRILQKAGT